MHLPDVTQCDAEECAYNTDRHCHAAAITVGGPGEGALCDTYCDLSLHGGEEDMNAGVGACKVAECCHNEDLQCHAPAINVGHVGDDVRCLTFEMG
jgi:hypothetical protein